MKKKKSKFIHETLRNECYEENMAPVKSKVGQQLQADGELGLSSGVSIHAPPSVLAKG